MHSRAINIQVCFTCYAQIKKFDRFAMQLLEIDLKNRLKIVVNSIPREMNCFLIYLFIGRYWLTTTFIT